MRKCPACPGKQPRVVLTGLLVAVLAGVVVGLTCLLPRSDEPAYNGKRLRFWLETIHKRGTVVPGGEVEFAIRQIGTNGLPQLLRMISIKDESPLERKLLEQLSLPSRLRYHLLSADDVHWDGNGGFLVLGPAATPAVPALVDLLEHDSSREVRSHAVVALSRIGPGASAAIPALLRHMSNDTDSVVRVMAIQALGEIHGRPDQVVPALIENWEDSQGRPDVLEARMWALGRFGKDARESVPFLASFLNHTNGNAAVQSSLRARAGNALKQIDSEAAAKAGVQ